VVQWDVLLGLRWAWCYNTTRGATSASLSQSDYILFQALVSPLYGWDLDCLFHQYKVPRRTLLYMKCLWQIIHIQSYLLVTIADILSLTSLPPLAEHIACSEQNFGHILLLAELVMSSRCIC